MQPGICTLAFIVLHHVRTINPKPVLGYIRMENSHSVSCETLEMPCLEGFHGIAENHLIQLVTSCVLVTMMLFQIYG
jgi:hypothetical protein